MTKSNVHCAVYTRKSSEEGLEQDFNSLDAQREACESYIKSQKHEGWLALEDRYDDGGLSGATMERPALKRLLEGVRLRRIDVVVVYKVDRLTRSLADFAKIVETFDAHGISFVSVTQQFNTTTSMGRLTLNVLLSFAQFEREVTAERIRDKIAASKKKGMWMGGNVPLGYDARDRSLLINETEAEVVRTLFQLYVDHGSVDAVVEQARLLGLTNKAGGPFIAGPLYHLLQNPIYIGRIRHKDIVYPGLHPALIEAGVWDRVQTRLAENRIVRANGTHAQEPSLLAGLLSDDSGHRFTPSHAVKRGRRYRYYVQRLDAAERIPGRKPRLKRLPAPEIEGIVVDALVNLLGSPHDLEEALGATSASIERARAMVEGGARIADIVRTEGTGRNALIRSFLAGVIMSQDAIRIAVDRVALENVVQEGGRGNLTASELVEDAGTRSTFSTGQGIAGGTGRDRPRVVGHATRDQHTIVVPASIRMRGNEVRFVVAGHDSDRKCVPDASLIRIVVQGHDWFQRLLTGQARSLQDIAAAEGVTDRYVRRLINLAFLAPDITAAILDGTQAVDLTAERITDLIPLPAHWAEQRRLLGAI